MREIFGIRISEDCFIPYGKESNIIDLAGACSHFVRQQASVHD